MIGLPVVALAGLFIYKTTLVPEGSARLSWTVPTENENDESLTDLAGYTVHCWAGAERFTVTIHIDDPAATSLLIEEIPPGTYDCAVSAVDARGEVSALSNVVAKSVR